MATRVPIKSSSRAVADQRAHDFDYPITGKQDELLDLYAAILIAVPLLFLIRWMWS